MKQKNEQLDKIKEATRKLNDKYFYELSRNLIKRDKNRFMQIATFKEGKHVIGRVTQMQYNKEHTLLYYTIRDASGKIYRVSHDNPGIVWLDDLTVRYKARVRRKRELVKRINDEQVKIRSIIAHNALCEIEGDRENIIDVDLDLLKIETRLSRKHTML